MVVLGGEKLLARWCEIDEHCDVDVRVFMIGDNLIVDHSASSNKL